MILMLALKNHAVALLQMTDSNSPTWSNMINGQINLHDANLSQIDYTPPGASSKSYSLSSNPAVLLVRPRGWHLPEPRIKVDGQEMSGSMVDFGLYFFHNVKALREKGRGVYLYLPKMEHHLEAR